MVSVLHLGLASRAVDELLSVLGQDSSALLPLCKFCPQSSAGLSWWWWWWEGVCGIFSSPTLQVFLQNSNPAWTAWPSSLAPPTQLSFTNHTSLHVPVIQIPDLNKKQHDCCDCREATEPCGLFTEGKCNQQVS